MKVNGYTFRGSNFALEKLTVVKKERLRLYVQVSQSSGQYGCDCHGVWVYFHVFSTISTKENYFCDFLLTSQDNIPSEVGFTLNPFLP